MRALGSVLAAAVLLASCSYAPVKDTAVSVSSARATQRAFVETSDFSGTLVASRAVTVGANAAGRLNSVQVQIGDRVEAGQVLATIDAAAYSAALSQASGAHAAAVADVHSAQAALLQAQARERLAAATAQRAAVLYQSGDVSRQHYDETQAALQTARAAAAQAEASIASASGNVAQSAAAIDAAAVPLHESVIRAPFAGIVTQKFADAGTVVNPGSPVVAMETNRSLEAEIAVPEALAARVQTGSSVRVDVDAIGSKIDGRIRAVIPSPNVQLHTAVVRVSVDLRAGLLRGMFVRVRLASQPQRHVAVPSSALATRAGQTGVFIVGNGRVSFAPVETGETNDGWIAVTGISAGTLVATSGVERLDDGTVIAAR